MKNYSVALKDANKRFSEAHDRYVRAARRVGKHKLFGVGLGMFVAGFIAGALIF